MRPQALMVCIVLAALPVAPTTAQSARQTPLVRAVEQTKDSVVNISTERIVLQRKLGSSRRSADPFDRLFEQYFRPHDYQRARVVTPLGSGIVLDERGLVVTNAHVIRRAGNLKLSLADGTQLDAELLAADFDKDLALLRIVDPKRKLRPVRMCRTSPMLGETVLALGNPFGLSNSVTSGIVSSLDREVTLGEGEDRRKFKGLIQTSALINPGNSGGPLVNLDAELAGINTAIVDHAQGIGFALPVPHVRKVLASLLATPELRQVQLGVAFHPKSPLKVARVVPRSPSEAAGLRVGDEIESIQGRATQDAFDVGMALVYRRPGDRISVGYRRDGGRYTANVLLVKPEPPSDGDRVQRLLGVAGRDVTRELALSMQLPVAWGVLVTRVEARGPARREGIEAGDLLVQIGPYRVQNVAQAARILRKARSGDRVFVVIVRGGYLEQVRIRVR